MLCQPLEAYQCYVSPSEPINAMSAPQSLSRTSMQSPSLRAYQGPASPHSLYQLQSYNVSFWDPIEDLPAISNISSCSLSRTSLKCLTRTCLQCSSVATVSALLLLLLLCCYCCLSSVPTLHLCFVATFAAASLLLLLMLCRTNSCCSADVEHCCYCSCCCHSWSATELLVVCLLSVSSSGVSVSRSSHKDKHALITLTLKCRIHKILNLISFLVHFRSTFQYIYIQICITGNHFSSVLRR